MATTNKIEWSDSFYDVSLDFGADQRVQEYEEDAVEYRRLLRRLDGAVDGGMESLEMVRDDADPLRFDYDLLARDGRSWSQSLQLASAADDDPQSSYTVAPPGWTVAEVEAVRRVQALLVKWVTLYQLVKSEVVFKA